MPETILYRNWRGEVSVRKIKIDALACGNEALGLHFCSNEWHPEEQWILFAHDVEKDARRGFTLSGILAWGEQAIADRDAALATAVARARREALEEAAGIADAKAGFWEREDYPFRARGARSVALDIRALAATPPEARQTETGWKLVPEEPTKEMLSFWGEQIINGRGNYRAMLAAAPPPPAIGNLEGEGRL